MMAASYQSTTVSAGQYINVTYFNNDGNSGCAAWWWTHHISQCSCKIVRIATLVKINFCQNVNVNYFNDGKPLINQFHPDDGWQSSNHYQTTISGFYKLACLINSLSQADIPQTAHNNNVNNVHRWYNYELADTTSYAADHFNDERQVCLRRTAGEAEWIMSNRHEDIVIRQSLMNCEKVIIDMGLHRMAPLWIVTRVEW